MIGKRAQVVIGIGLLIISAAFLLIGLDYALLQGTFLTNGVSSASLFAQAISAAENSIAMSSGEMQITIYGNNSLCTWDPSLLAYVCQGGSKIENISFAEGPTLDPGVEQFAGGVCLSVMVNPLGKFGGGAEDEAADQAASVADNSQSAFGAATTGAQQDGKQAIEDATNAGNPTANDINTLDEDTSEAEEEDAKTGSLSLSPAVLYNNAKQSFLSSVGVMKSLVSGGSIEDFVSSIVSRKITAVAILKFIGKFALQSMVNYAVFYGLSALVYFGVPSIVDFTTDTVKFAQGLTSTVAFTIGKYSPLTTISMFLAGSRESANSALAVVYSKYANSERAVSAIFPPSSPQYIQTAKTAGADIAFSGALANDPPFPTGIFPTLGANLGNLPQIIAKLPVSPSLKQWLNTVGDALTPSPTVSQFYGSVGVLLLTYLGDAQCLQIALGSSPTDIVNTISGALSLLTAYEVQNDRALIGTYYVGDTGAVYFEGEYQGKQMQVASPVIVDGQDLCEFAHNSPPINSTLVSYLQPAYNGNLNFNEYQGLFNTQCNPSEKGFPITLAQFINNIINGDQKVYINLPSDMALVFENYSTFSKEQICIYQLAENPYGTPTMKIIQKAYHFSPINLHTEAGIAVNNYENIGVELFGYPIECIPASYIYQHTGINISISPDPNLMQNGTEFFVNSQNNLGFSVPPNRYVDEFSVRASSNPYSIDNPSYLGGSAYYGQYIPGNVFVSKVSAGLESGTVTLIARLFGSKAIIGVSAPNYASNFPDTILNIWKSAFGISGSSPYSAITPAAYTGLVLSGLTGSGIPVIISTGFAIVNSLMASVFAGVTYTGASNLSFAPLDYGSLYFINNNGQLSFDNYTTLYAVYPNSPSLVINGEYTSRIHAV